MGARDLLAELTGAGFSVAADGDRLVIRPASLLTDDMRAALRASKPDLLALLADNRAEADAARYQDRRARLLRWGWAAGDAEKLAARLTRRDREADPRVSCADCGHFRPWRCANHERAGLKSADCGRAWAELLQRCPGFSEACRDHARERGAT